MATDPVLDEIAGQLAVASDALATANRALSNVRAFVARVNRDTEPAVPNVDGDGDEPMETYEDNALPAFAAPTTTNGGRNGRKDKQRR